MHLDDRLATVLRHRAGGTRVAATQFRQLLDLLGSRRHGRDESLLAAAWLRLAALGESIPPEERAVMVREPGLRFRNPELALHLAEDEPEVAAAALGVAQLSEDDWEALIPRLPIRARGFLRMRRDLTAATRELLERLGIHDRGLPRPATIADVIELTEEAPAEAPARPAVHVRPLPANDLASDDAPARRLAPAPALAAPGDDADSAIGALVRRIEAYRKTRAPRAAGDEAPRLPLGETNAEPRPPFAGFAFTTDAEGRIVWADGAAAPMVTGALLAPAAVAARQRRPIDTAALEWSGAPQVAGSWVIDAAPRFSTPDGRFTGYAGRFRRPLPVEAAREIDPAADRMRELLHELKNPVNAVQGYAEMIQQQLFGPVPHEYRALAAAIAGDAARILAGFDELDRLARLETGALDLEPGEADLAAIFGGLAEQLGAVLRTRGGAFALDLPDGPCRVAYGTHEVEALGWRLLATVTGAAGPGETLPLAIGCTGGNVRVSCALPGSLAGSADVFASETRAGGGAVSAGMFGTGFALRLARAEARAAGGDLVHDGAALVLTLPRLTAAEANPSHPGMDAAAG